MILVNANLNKKSSGLPLSGKIFILNSDEVQANHLKIRLLNFKKKRLLSLYQELNEKLFFNPKSQIVAENVFSQYAKAKNEINRLEAINYKAFKENHPNLSRNLWELFQA